MTPESEITVLIVDDAPDNLKIMRDALKETGYKILVAKSGERALYQVERQPPDLILLDVLMPGLDGFETCRQLKLDPNLAHIPIIFVTALNDVDHKVKGFAVGGVDYITKPFQREEVLARVNTHLTIHQLRRQLETNNAELETRSNQLATALAQVEQLIRRSSDAIILIDETDRIVEWNPAAVLFTGWLRSKVIGRLAWDVQFELLPVEQQTPTAYDQVKANYLAYSQTSQKTRPTNPIEQVLRRADGSYRDVQSMPFELKIGSGMGVGYIIRDVTRLKQRERIDAAQLAVSRILAGSPAPAEGLRQLMESIACRLEWQLAELWWRDVACNCLKWQASWRAPDMPELDSFQQTAQERNFKPGDGLPGAVWQAGHAIWDKDLLIVPQRPRAPQAADIGLRSAVGLPLVVDEEIVGVMTFFTQSARPLDEQLLTVLTDLGYQIGQFLARKQAEADLAEERASLARRVAERTAELSQALQTKDEFIATMSHELRTPLNVILGMIEILQEEVYGPLTERQRTPTQLIKQSGQQLLTMINEILDYAKIEAGKLSFEPQPVLALEVCQASLQTMNERAEEKEVSLSIQMAEDDLWLQADPYRLRQILVNLLGNGIKFTSPGGQVSLSVSTSPAQKTIHFAVQDNGIGIAAEDIPKLFEPFTQLDSSLARQYEGAGMGLALARQLTRLHGGKIEVRSDGIPGQGSCFTVSLPWQPD